MSGLIAFEAEHSSSTAASSTAASSTATAESSVRVATAAVASAVEIAVRGCATFSASIAAGVAIGIAAAASSSPGPPSKRRSALLVGHPAIRGQYLVHHWQMNVHVPSESLVA